MLSDDKCWYCESKQIRLDRHVDHYRPKNSVAECADHPGYWWLAFRSYNYRYSCTYCNSRRVDQRSGQAGGKADHFPLRDESRRAFSPDDPIDDEQPTLLDPTVQAASLSRLNKPTVFGRARSIDAQGDAAMRIDARYHAFRMNLPPGFSNVIGLDVYAAITGDR